MTGLVGDFAGLALLTKQLQAMAGGTFTRRATVLVGEEALTQIHIGFAQGRGPYGNAWAAPKLRAGRPMLDTGRLRNSWFVQSTSTTVRVSTSVAYAGVHQSGATIVPKSGDYLVFKPRGGDRFYSLKRAVIPARPMIPTGALPAKWEAAFRDVLIDLFVDHFEG